MNFIRFFILSLSLLVGCAHAPVDPEELNCSNVKEGMPRAQVIDVLGTPDSSEACGKEEVLSWDGIRVAFSKDVVVNKFETDEAFFFKMNVKATVTEVPTQKKVVIEPTTNVMQKDSPDFLTLKTLATPILEHKGYQIVENADEADAKIYVHTGISRLKARTSDATIFVRNFVMNAVSLHNSNLQFWKVSITSEGKTSNLKAAIPYLIVATEDFIEKNAKDSKTFVFQNDPRVKAISARNPASN